MDGQVIGLPVPELSEKMPCGHSLSRLAYKCETCIAEMESRIAAQEKSLISGCGEYNDAMQYRAETAESDLDRLHSALKGVSGALCDAATIPVPDDEMGYGDAVRALTKERDALKARLERMQEIAGQHRKFSSSPSAVAVAEYILAILDEGEPT